ncbi:hypothetical protein CTAYLR_004282 [Chrysophaeum taylorii]|uniref:Ankyrin repeat domain-containing protein n=1 Tax=Chrysophaeum taylorii TaxID=2483200 RepID=A0AAD7UGE7_9STRA|nr:hypothetical protein CTAYLR_004282 [Chrysophaeum taylorii]
MGTVELLLAIRLGDVAACRECLEAGASLGVHLLTRETPLHLAARRAHLGVTKLLLAHGADASARTPSGKLASDLVDPPHRHSMVREALRTAERDAAQATEAARLASSSSS